ncbi:MAG: DUF1476 domain-containing protein [Ancalomicrobiaceae bacterium]|nr:DUF1476 domain-containing protein [Ancalomicrobiaceae bacterium]
MSIFDRREQAFENRFAHDQDVEFRAVSRRNRLLGLWAAERLGLASDEASNYAQSIVFANFEHPGVDIFGLLRHDLANAGIVIPDSEIRLTMQNLLLKARDDIRSGN